MLKNLSKLKKKLNQLYYIILLKKHNKLNFN